MNTLRHLILFITNVFLSVTMLAQTGTIKGVMLDKQTQTPLPGGTIYVQGKGFSTDMDGNYSITLLKGAYTFSYSYISYTTMNVENIYIQEGKEIVLNIEMESESMNLHEITVTAARLDNTEISVLNVLKTATAIMNGVSSQSIRRTQDRDASEVVKRIPGISIIGDRFIVIRGLAQRYNNAWINGMALPSSEADSRAFSFDIIPSSQIDNIMIVKTPTAEYPADYTGGFVMIRTKNTPDQNNVQISYGTGFNTETHFRNFLYNEGSGTDFLGFDNGMRQLKNVPARIDNNNVDIVDRVTKSGFNNNWTIKNVHPLPDQRLNVVVNQFRTTASDKKLGMTLAVNYGYVNKTIENMDNSEFGVYSSTVDKPMYRRHYKDDVYTTDVKLGALANLSLISGNAAGDVHKLELRNIFNQLGRNRYILREGFQNISGFYECLEEEFFYQNRSSYSGQAAGDHLFGNSKNNITWNIGYAFSNCNQPDRRIVERQKDETNGVFEYAVDQSDFQRYFTQLDENIISGAVNYIHKISIGSSKPIEIKTGLLGVNTSRTYRTRKFLYKWRLSDNTLPANFESLPTNEIMSPENMGAINKIYIQDNTDNTNNYDARNTTLAGYAALNIPLGRFNIYAGARFERSLTVMTAYTQGNTDKHRFDNYTYNDVFPSFNASFNITKNSLLRLAYGITVNRPELRELTGSSYYDFEIFGFVLGNPNLQQATIHNVDIRYEHYFDNSSDMFSVALFLKQFQNPIEVTLTQTGGKPQFSCDNALSARNLGVEIDVRKQLDFIGLNNLIASINVTLVNSSLHFKADSRGHDRPMQGQSPYIINTGLFYRTPNGAVDLGLFYNRIGERIVGLGTVSNSSGGDSSNDVPDLYELPRNILDFTVSFRMNKTFEIKGSIRDILAERIECAQYPTFIDKNNNERKRTQITKSYNPGQSFQIILSATF